MWRDADGRIFAYTDREYFIYHFPRMLEGYIQDKKQNLGYQSETSLILGLDFITMMRIGGYILGVIGYLCTMDILIMLIIMRLIIKLI